MTFKLMIFDVLIFTYSFFDIFKMGSLETQSFPNIK